MTETENVTWLEQKAAEIRARLDPTAADAAVQQAVDRLKEKFSHEYGAEPPATMIADVRKKATAEYDQAVAADLNGLKETFDTVLNLLERDILQAQDVPDEVAHHLAQRRSGGLSLSEETALRTLEHLRQRDLMADLRDAPFSVIAKMYDGAVGDGDRITQRTIEAAQRQGWPGTHGGPPDTQALLALDANIKRTREERVPADRREAHVRLKKLWSASLDTQHRHVTRGLKIAGR